MVKPTRLSFLGTLLLCAMPLFDRCLTARADTHAEGGNSTDCDVGARAGQCFQAEKLDLSQLRSDVIPGADVTDESSLASFVASVFSRDFVQTKCSQKGQLENATGCVDRAMSECPDSNFTMSPAVLDLVDFVTESTCFYKNDINDTCMADVKKRMEDCLKNSNTQKVCLTSGFYGNCVTTLLPACGCPTMATYVKWSTTVNPAGCPSLGLDPPECDPDTKDFVNGARGTCDLCALSLLLLVAIALFTV